MLLRGRKPTYRVTTGDILAGIAWLVFFGLLIFTGSFHGSRSLTTVDLSARPVAGGR
jgi:hypothetical protein